MKKKYVIILVVILLSLSSFQGVALGDASNGKYTSGYSKNQDKYAATYVYPHFKKTANYQLYNNEEVIVYKDATASSSKIGTYKPRRWVSTERKGDWFFVKTPKGKGWIYVDTDVDLKERPVELREIEAITAKLVIKQKVYIHKAPFEKYKTGKRIKSGTYLIEKKAGDWYYIKRKGWITTKKANFPGVPIKMKENHLLFKKRTIPIKQSIVKISEKVRPGTPLKPMYITIHNTSNTNIGADAKMHADYLHNQAAFNMRWASWHYSVDDKEIYQSLPLNENGWHAGDGEGPGNRSSIAIEITENRDGNYAISQENAAYLTAALLHTFHVPFNQIEKWVVTHQSWSGKNCPATILNQPNGFHGFLEQVCNAYIDLKSKWGQAPTIFDITI
ncbi:MAG: N-acetylmuramoyl-L-alanine amidase [Bacillaceae bacterium]